MAKPEHFDPRLTPARPDLAAKYLRGRVHADQYVAARPMQVGVFLAPLFGSPDAQSPLQTQLLLGERFAVYEQKDGWAWGQASRDGYVGYVPDDMLVDMVAAPDRQISALRTPVFSAPDLKAPVVGFAHQHSIFAAQGIKDRYVQIGPKAGWVFTGHTNALDEIAADWVSVACFYLESPYVWGGRSSFGLDCSALVQNALQAGGIKAGRDSDMLEKELGSPVEIEESLSGLERGDLIFWKGHVGIMLDGINFLHANAYHMKVAQEPLAQAAARIKKTAGPIRAIRRL